METAATFVTSFAKSITSTAITESAPYQVLQTFDNGCEERVYPSQKWAVTESTLNETNEGQQSKTDMFFALFGYISGKNEKSQKIAMTVPVSTQVEPVTTTEANGNLSCQMGFYIPKEFQENTPQPTTDSRVKIIERKLHVYTITFGGYRNDQVEKSKLEELLKFTKEKGLPLASEKDEVSPIYFTVGYDPPHKFWGRKNEIWIMAA